MKTVFKSAFVLALFVSTSIVSLHVLAGGSFNQASPTSNNALVSHRLIVKYRPNGLPAGLSVAQINEAMSKPLSVTVMGQITSIAGAPLKELHALPHGSHVLAFPNTPSRVVMDQTIAAIAALPDVEFVEEDRIMTIQLSPNDTYYTTGPAGNPGLWGLRPVTPIASPAPGNTGNYGADFQTAWDTNTGNGVVVAVIDTGITPHDDIVGSGGTVSPATGNLVSPGYDFTTDCRIRASCAASTTSNTSVAPSADATDLGDFVSSADTANAFFSACTVGNSSWHGTHVSGTIAAIGNNNANVIGGAFNAKILPVRALGKCGGFTSDIANGILWAAGVHPTIINPNPAKVINMSLGGSGSCSGNVTFQNAINAAVAAGTTVVVAAGNSNADVANFSPASCNNVISVASIGRDGSRAYYSNFSSPVSNSTPVSITLAAQGGNMLRPSSFDPGILSTLNSGTTTASTSTLAYYQGTSMATPHVVAAVALMRSRNPTLTPAQVKTILTSPISLTSFPSFNGSAVVTTAFDCATSLNCGSGILNAKFAVQNSIVPLSASSPTSDFGLVGLGATASLSQTFTNSSLLPVSTGVTTITGSNASLFSFTSNTCQSVSVAVNASCQITMSYTPSVSGSHSATLTIPTGVVGVGTAVGLIGIGGASLTTATPAVTAATVSVGMSTLVNLSYTNPNAFSVGVGSAVLSNPTIMALSTNNCSNTTLTAGASCNLNVTVTPNAVGAYSGTVSIGLAVGGTPTQSTISGTATATPPAASGGGGGCTVMPAGAVPDWSLILVALLVLTYWLTRRALDPRSAD